MRHSLLWLGGITYFTGPALMLLACGGEGSPAGRAMGGMLSQSTAGAPAGGGAAAGSSTAEAGGNGGFAGGSASGGSSERGGAFGEGGTPEPADSGGATSNHNTAGSNTGGGNTTEGGSGGIPSEAGSGNVVAQGGNGTAPSGGGTGGTAASGGGTGGATSSDGFLRVEGSQLLDQDGNVVRLTGVNWFGFETGNLSPHGLWARDYRSMLRQIADVGFNTVRIPWCNRMLRDGAVAVSINVDGADPYDGTEPMNGPLEELSPIEILDLIIESAAEVGLRVMLDNHSREPDGYMEEKVWYTEQTSETQWIEDWRFMAARYRGNPTVVAFDLNNEPHGESSWGTSNPDTDWNGAAERCGNAILEVNPDALIIVEGVEKVGDDGYWWGGNLSGARQYPIALSNPSKLVYSAHEYGPEVHVQPWFESAEFPANLASIWDDHFGYLVSESLGHVFIGEFGMKDPEAFEGKSQVWFDTFLQYIGPDYSWTFWCWNPNSGDTEGILEYDWLTPKQWKLDALGPYLAPPL